MSKFHINSDGNPGQCSAKQGGCPFASENDHFDTPEAARKNFEKLNSADLIMKSLNRSALADSKEKDLAVLRENAKKAYETGFPSSQFKTEDFQDIRDALSNRISDERADRFLVRNYSKETINTYPGDTAFKNVQTVFEHVRKVRAQSNRPPTIPTVKTFDPKKQTAFTDTDARDDPSVAIDSVMKLVLDVKHKIQKARKDLEYSKDPSLHVESQDEFAASAQVNAKEAELLGARINAMVNEISWLEHNNKDFSSKLDRSMKKTLSQIGSNIVFHDFPILEIKDLPRKR